MAISKHFLYACTALTLLPAVPVEAQVTQPADGAQSVAAPSTDNIGSGSDTGLQDIVVTAQKRAENLQRVPIAVTAASGPELTARGITSSMQLNTVAPGLNIRTTAGAFQPSIRGVGTSSNFVENPVALYIDGVYLPNQREGMRELNDVSQIAVLKGPQGTLFGRNATGGVIQITTAAPSETFSAKAKAEIDNYGTVRTSAYATGGLTPGVSASLGIAYATQDEGWGKNLTTGNDTFKLRHDFSARGKIKFELGADTEATLIGDYMDRSELTNAFQPYNGSTLAFPGGVAVSLPRPTSVHDGYGVDSYNNFKGGGVSLTAEHNFSFAQLLSITSYRQNKYSYQFDNSAVPGAFFVVTSPKTRAKSFTQEVQLISTKSGPLTWVLGACLSSEHLAQLAA
ncbi:TonB-dependent receptor [Sphingobium phenoxybenzoativorans]|uniref:TonB-dependent receptor n=1 Tax=Sphingobium phenoxybenzoativorans TaxID=1592790 RepID=A0A975K7M9_9SPHN|nr:TonB-dependent receptor [Sphingobium phenoxybenzoativorans]QUT05583.1 TonB-dependent receptor [Sphingobium phenoxybenzoativorans]